MRVDHVESTGLGDEHAPQLGDRLDVTAYVSLGDLTPDDVEVQVLHGRVHASDDDLAEVVPVPLAHAEAYEAGRHRYAAGVTLDRTGPFGYTVRVLPRHPRLASPAELGCVTWAR